MTWIKVSDEGTRSPFMARIFMGMLELRDQFYLINTEDKERQTKLSDFDRQFEPMVEAAQATRDAGRSLVIRLNKYASAIHSGEVISIEKGQVQIKRTIDTELRQDFNKLINQSVVSIKSNLQSILAKLFKIEIGFIFQKKQPFEDKLNDLRKSGNDSLADYLAAVRSNWLEDVLTIRNQIEHEGWVLGRIEFIPIREGMFIKLPEVSGVPVSLFSAQLVNRALMFIENMMVFGMQQFPPYPLYVTEIPKKDRNPISPSRFRLSAHGLEEVEEWKIYYSEGQDFLDEFGNIVPPN